MKRIFFAIAAILPVLSFGQSFEGSIKFKIEYGGDQASMMQMMAPASNTIIIKGKKTKVLIEGGSMASMIGNVVNNGDGNAYFVQDANKTVYKTTSDELKKNESDISATKEKSTAVILGYKCQKYKVTAEKGTTYVWATKEIDLGDVDYRGKMAYKGVEGFILKQEMNISDQGQNITVTMTAVNFEKKKVNENEFVIPADYKVEEGLPPILKMQQGK